MHDPVAKSSADDGNANRWSTAEALELWKYFGGVGGADKNTMVTTSSWLLGFSAAILGYIVTNLLEGSPVRIVEPFTAILLALVGFFVSFMAGYVSFLYGGYANRNWATADAIAFTRKVQEPKWSDLLHPDLVPRVSGASWCHRLAERFSEPCDHARKLAPVFGLFAIFAASAAAIDLGIVIWAITCLMFAPSHSVAV